MTQNHLSSGFIVDSDEDEEDGESSGELINAEAEEDEDEEESEARHAEGSEGVQESEDQQEVNAEEDSEDEEEDGEDEDEDLLGYGGLLLLKCILFTDNSFTFRIPRPRLRPYHMSAFGVNPMTRAWLKKKAFEEFLANKEKEAVEEFNATKARLADLEKTLHAISKRKKAADVISDARCVSSR